eukprot:COSAG01_NODE_1158_length_11469_cov_101.645646_5_plen_639_part_00
MQTRIRQSMLSPGAIHFPGSDREENKELVDELMDEFISECERKSKARVQAKRQFLARVNRPTLSRAFFSWKFSVRKTDDSQLSQASGMFAEPLLPWNVRHPKSKFTNAWEAIQAVLLIYVAFGTIWRIAFNVDPTGIFYWFELSIDIYFTADVVLNFHTAYYNDSGDLVGVKTGGSKVGRADYWALYSNYARGWMVIDVASVIPVGFIMDKLEQGDSDTGGHLKTIKILRLLRLLKLLRLVRAMRIFKKYEDQVGPALSGLVLIMTVGLAVHTITCLWYYAGTLSNTSGSSLASSSGWVEFTFQGSHRHCSCYGDGNGNTLTYDSLERSCFNATDDTVLMKEPCTEAENLPSPWEYYTQAMFTSLSKADIHPDYDLSIPEMLFAAGATATLGFMWGAVAGAWSTVFAANQMASQAYKMKIRTVREFCKVKQLDWGVRAKLVAHYEHLYPEQVIVKEDEIIDELPPRMRDELVREMYGQIISSVPLFFGLQTAVLTELCLSLKVTPALKGQVIAREGTKGHNMYVIESGNCRVTQHLHIGDDVERARGWIEEVFAAHNKKLKLYSPNERQILEQLLKAIKKIARRKKRAADAAEAARALSQTRDALQAASRDVGQRMSQDEDEQPVIATLFEVPHPRHK